jgi:hypothetical protein
MGPLPNFSSDYNAAYADELAEIDAAIFFPVKQIF